MDNASRFAALVPVCGAIAPDRAHLLNNMPIWAFHGDADDMAPVQTTIDMVSAVRAAGGDPKCTIYKDVGHMECCFLAFSDRVMYDWLFSQKRKSDQGKILNRS